MKNDIIITAQGHKGTMERLQNEFKAVKLWEAPDRDAALKAASQLRALAHFGHSKVDGKLMDALPKLELISNFGVGVDQIDLEAAKQRKILVTNTPDVLNECVADCALALTLNTLRKFPQSESYLRAGYWPTKGPYPLTTSLGGKTMGILGRADDHHPGRRRHAPNRRRQGPGRARPPRLPRQRGARLGGG
jgi:lactate dehydrogenase-like 2-hydroxyacid dehydrogenase